MRGEALPCQAVAQVLPRVVDGSRRADRVLIRHVERCLPCQAELARYRRMLRLLHQLRDQRPPLPAGGLGDVLVDLEIRAGHQVVRSALGGRRRRVAGVVTGVVAVAALVAVGAVAALSDGVVADRPPARRRPGSGTGVGARAGRSGALLTLAGGPSGYGSPATAAAAALRTAEGQ